MKEAISSKKAVSDVITSLTDPIHPDTTRTLNYLDRPSLKIQNLNQRRPKKEEAIDKRYLVETKDVAEKKVNELIDDQVSKQESHGHIKRERVKTKQEPAEKEDPRLLTEADQDALCLMEMMQNAFQEDIRAFQQAKMAHRKVKLLTTISQYLENVLTRRKFLQNGGLEKLSAWLFPVQDSQNRWVEPSIALKMGILRIVDNLSMSSQQIGQFATQLHGLIYKNMMGSKISELKDMCNSVLKGWDYTLYKQTGQGKRKK